MAKFAVSHSKCDPISLEENCFTPTSRSLARKRSYRDEDGLRRGQLKGFDEFHLGLPLMVIDCHHSGFVKVSWSFTFLGSY